MGVRGHRWVAGALAVLVAGTLGTLSAPSALAFGTINGLGQQAEHEMITRAALGCKTGTSSGDCFEPKSLDALAGVNGTFGAVGSPDLRRPLVTAQHCDDGDYLPKAQYDGKVYPQSAAKATAAIVGCINYARNNQTNAVSRAQGLLDSGGHLIKRQAAIDPPCIFNYIPGIAKCNVLEDFGSLLHGTQDFYSHSNYADVADPTAPIGRLNPPGLGLSVPAPELGLRATVAPTLTPGLITGCFALPDTDDGVFGCDKHVTHSTLNKDKGTINGSTGATSGPTTRRGQIISGGIDNFHRAVAGAISDTVRQWKDLRAAIEASYPKTGALIICALTRDDPIKDCSGRKLAIVIDSSGSNQDTDPGGLRISAGQAFNSTLRTEDSTKGTDERPDRSAVIDFDDSARVISPLDDPSKASFAGIDANGGTLIASGVSAGISELTKDTPDETKDHSGIVVLTDGQDSNVQALVNEVNRAGSLGIRVSFGFLSPPTSVLSAGGATSAAAPTPSSRNGDLAGVSSLVAADASAPTSLTEAILATGGFFATINSAKAQQDFVDVVTQRGATLIDDVNGSDDGGELRPGLEVTGLASPGSEDHFTYPAEAGRALSIAVRTTGDPVTAALDDVAAGRQVAVGTTGQDGTTTLSFVPATKGPLELRVRTSSSTPSVYSVKLDVDQTATTGTVTAGGVCGANGRSGTLNLALAGPSTAITVSAASSNTALLPNANITVAGTGTARTVTATTVFGRTGTAVVTLTVADGHTSTTTTFTVIAGGFGNDTLTGTAGPDLLLGMLGTDTLRGLGGNDLLCAGLGSGDTLDGGDGDDTLIGSLGNHTLTGGPGNDTLTGGIGPDRFSGGPGTDTATNFNRLLGDTQDGTIP